MKKTQMSQRLCRYAMAMAFYAVTMSGFLSYAEKEPLSDITIAVVGLLTTLINVGYFALSGARDCSLNNLKAKLKEGESDGQ